MKALTVLVCSMSFVLFGCSKSQKSDSVVLNGTWSGEETGRRANGSASLLIDGSTLEFHGANTNEWYKAAFSIRGDTSPKQLVIVITDCPAPQYVGKTGYAIYEIKDGTLTITGNEPGNPAVPTGFDAPGARKLVFKRK
jgi:uncharacterized protein (TIGR03067 family)